MQMGRVGRCCAESTIVLFRRTNFLNNIALKGPAGVSGATSDERRLHSLLLLLHFCREPRP